MFTNKLSLFHQYQIMMSGERKYVRQVVAYANYFKDFKKTLSKETLQKIYQIFIYIMTQEQLAAKIGTKKSYISRIENGHTDIQLSTLFRIFQGLGRKVSLTIL